MNTIPGAQASTIHTLTSLIQTSIPSPTSTSPGPSRKLYPTDDQILAVLQARSRAELPYTRIGDSDYVVVNPLRTLGIVSEESRRACQVDVEECTGGIGDPSVYELAGRIWLLMTRRRESQAVIYHGLTGSGKSTSSKHLTTQLLHLASPTRIQTRLSDQIHSFQTLLESFGSSKTQLNPSASQHSRYTELHFSSDGRISGAKVLPFGLNKSRVGRLGQEERSFHVFYQLLAGATPEERDAFGLEDPTSYELLSRSGCYRLPGGPFSDDSAQLSELRVAFASLGFKVKHVRSILSLLSAILLLSNLTFIDNLRAGSLGMISMDQPARVHERSLLVEISGLLGISADELENVLVNRTRWVQNDLCSMILDSSGASDQRYTLMRDLYAILFAFVVDLGNRKLSPPNNSAPELMVIQLELPGYTTRTVDSGDRYSVMGTLVNASGSNGFDEFAVNFQNELLFSYIQERTFSESVSSAAHDEVKLPSVMAMVNSGCMDLLRGGLLSNTRLAGEPDGMIRVLSSLKELKADPNPQSRSSKLCDKLTNKFGRHTSFVSIPGQAMFGINHYSGTCSYDTTDFIEKNNDGIDKQLVELLKSSSDGFIAKLVSGPSLANEFHPNDNEIVVESQVSVTPLRTPTAIVNPLIGSQPGTEEEWPIDTSSPHPVTTQLNTVLSTLLGNISKTRLWTMYHIRPNDSGHANSFDKRRVKQQIKSLLLPDLVNRRQVDYVVDYSFDEFCLRHGLRFGPNGASEVESFARSRQWIKGVDHAVGRERLWLSWKAWRDQEDLLRAEDVRRGSGEETLADDLAEDVEQLGSPRGYGEGGLRSGHRDLSGSSEDLISKRQTSGYGDNMPTGGEWGYNPLDPDATPVIHTPTLYKDPNSPTIDGDSEDIIPYTDDDMIVKPRKHHSTTEIVTTTTTARRWWLRITWTLTFWIPSFLLSELGRMKRPDIRMAWREKMAIFMMIFMLCGTVVFYIVFFGRLLCPDSDKAWNTSELAQHAGTNDYYATIAGKVYDFTNFYKSQHSDLSSYTTSSEVMLEFAGQDLTNYFPPPMTVACPGLVTNDDLALQRANFTPILAYAVHTSGKLQTTGGTKLNNDNWYTNTLLTSLVQYYKGSFVYTTAEVSSQADYSGRQWAIYNNNIYDLSDYLYTVKYYSQSSGTDLPNYAFLDSDLSTLFSAQAGQDITSPMKKILDSLPSANASATMKCLDTAFYVGQLDFRLTPRCTVQNYLLLAFSCVLMFTIAMKFLAALQLGSKRHPELLDKFVICQVPCYTEGEESLKKTIDSLASLRYDDKRKLIFIICDGNIIGSGNNRPTPRIVLDILGVDPKLDPEPLLFKSIGDGSRQLNYGKIYSGLYEFEGHVVPYVVVVKVGKPTETSKPGNRGKRDSQVLLLQYLNRVHFDAPMSPLELEIYHQMRNVIGIDPTFYEYIFQVDADTTVEPDSLNRMISCAADDQRIIGICGETKLANERESLTTMIQVYEYYISHHLTKAFESLFGSVTCLPGCFSVYRIRTADKGRPVIISSIVIDEYAEPNVDTLHKKNLFSLGEDRYLTTLMMKHFPTFKMKFTPDAIAWTVAPSRWNVLLSQRRRWINSTIHNLVELLFLPEMCGFCFFSMRFIVFIDLLGTIILPATCVYLIYLVVVVASGKAAIPVISLAMLGAVYGLQAIIFIIKREFMLIGWMVVYILAFPIYSFFLPVYSFWSMDDFSWGNTRQVVGEGSKKTIRYEDDEPFHEDQIPYKSFKEYESNAWETASLHSEKSRATSHHTSVTGVLGKGRPYGRSGVNSAYSSTTNLLPGQNYYRDSSPLGPAHSSRDLRYSTSNPSLRASPSNPFMGGTSPFPSQSRVQSMAGLSQWGAGSVLDFPSAGYPLPMQQMNPFDSPHGSEHASLRPPGFASPYMQPSPMGMYSPFASPSMGNLGIGMGVPRNSVMTNLGGGLLQPSLPQRMSTYSLATTTSPFAAGPPLKVDEASNPSDEEILAVLRQYLATQDLGTRTKRTTREALFALFPNANLRDRVAWVNEGIDYILQ